jgi:histidinol-phosphate phosphatase family protein
MRIAMISEHASPLACIGGVDSGGQNVYVAQVARCLAEAGHEVDVFTRQDAPGLARVVDMAPRCRVVHVQAGPTAFVPKERLLDHMPEFARFCHAWMRTAPRYDVIHANFFMSGWVGLRLKEALGLPLVTTFHALGLVRREHQGDADTFPQERIAIEQALVARSDLLVAECPQDELDLQRLYGAERRRMALVPCGFDADEFAPVDRADARRRLGIPFDEFMVLQLGRMVPRKGVETVVRAMAEPACAGMRLRVVGGDCDVADAERTPEIGRLMDVAHACGAADRVRFEGRKTRAELRLWYAACDVFVTTPWYEPFGITPLEAMACARPVVGSAVGGVQYSVVDGVTGLLVPPKDPAALARALAALAARPERARRMGEAGLARVRESFTWDGVAASLATVFAEAARAARPPSPRFHVVGVHAPVAATARAGAGAGAPAIFLDKDGTLVHDVPYNVDPARLRVTDGAMEAIRRWRAAGYRIVVVTNQSGIGRGLFDVAALERLHVALAGRLAEADAAIDGFFACPHTADAHCACRKPRPGMLLEAARALDIDLERSWMIGDILNDVEAGHRAGCRGVLVDNGNETEWLEGPMRTPDLRCANLLEAAVLTLRSTPASAALAADVAREASA